jgi:TrmH RNA methyltransferase
LIPRFSDALRWAANQRKAYHVVQREDLERLTESTHHQGICILALEHAPIPFRAVDSRLCQLKGPQLLVYLDGVENPHNFGAILRSCAHFGARYVLGDASRLPTLSPSACRVAEGGAEHVSVIQLDRPTEQLQMLKDAGYQLCSTAVHRGRNLFRHHFAPRSILALGAEETGVTATVARLADARLTIPGAATVESLNVGVAFAVFAAEFYRQSASDD